MYKYSIIMPVYNAMDSVSKSIESIINQTYQKWELIIIDDGSTDDTIEILNSYRIKDERIKVFQQENLGPGEARNNGLKRAEGDYIAFIDADDYYENDYLELVNEKISIKHYDIVFINTINEKKDGTQLYCDNLSKYRNCTKDQLIKLQMVGTMPWGPCSKIVKKDIVKNCSFSNLKVGEEAVYSFKILVNSENYTFIEKPIYHYVHNELGQHTKGGFNPWMPVVESIFESVKQINQIKKYEKAINSLALKALSISIYRYSCNFNMKEGKIKIKEIIKEYEEKYNFQKIDLKLISKSQFFILFLIKIKLYSVLIIASRFRKKIYQ